MCARGVSCPGYGLSDQGCNRGTPLQRGKVLNVSDTDDDKKALTRALHEATKDAWIAKRELQRERERLSKDLKKAQELIGKDFTELAGRIVAEYMVGLNSSLARHAADINETVASADETIRRCAADLAGMTDPDEFTGTVVSRISADITQALDERFLTLVDKFYRGQTDAKQHGGRRAMPRLKPTPPPVTIASPYQPDYLIQLQKRGSGK